MHGVSATASYRVFPNSLPDTSQLVGTIRTNGFEGVLIVRRLPTEKNAHYVAGYISTEQNVRYSSHWQKYFTYYTEIEHPGYIDTQKVALSSITVTTTGNEGRMIWSATSRTPDPGAVPDKERGIAGLVVSELAQQRIISSRK